MKSLKWAFVLTFILAVGMGVAEAKSLTEQEMNRIWRMNGAESGVQEFQFGLVDWETRTVAVTGSGRLQGEGSQAKLLAKRKAVADAQRNLLYLLYELRYGLPERISAIEVQGHVVMGHIDRQVVEDDSVLLEVSLPLKRLLEECVIWKAQVE